MNLPVLAFAKIQVRRHKSEGLNSRRVDIRYIAIRSRSRSVRAKLNHRTARPTGYMIVCGLNVISSNECLKGDSPIFLILPLPSWNNDGS